MRGKILGLMTLFLVSILALCGAAYALPVSNIIVQVDDDIVLPSITTTVYGMERDQDLEVKVTFTADSDIEDMQIEASIRGYDHDDLMEDITDVFDVKSGVTYTKKLTIPLRYRMDQDRYKLRVRFEDRDGYTTERSYDLEIDTKRHSVMIKDVILSPDNEVKQGRALLATVRVKNYGEKDEEGIKIKVSIPELGVSASDYIDELERDGDDDDEETSEELYMRIPDCAETGDYKVKVEVTYDDGDEIETKEMSIRVIDGDTCQTGKPTSEEKTDKTILTIGPQTQDVAQGGSAIYPITITNAGTTSKTYTIEVDSANWGTFSVSPSNVVILDSGESRAVYVYANPSADAAVGEQMFVVTVKSADKTLKQVALKANVTAKQSTFGSLKNALEIGLVILVVLLVILGLIIGFNKLRGREDEEGKEDSSTYY